MGCHDGHVWGTDCEVCGRDLEPGSLGWRARAEGMTAAEEEGGDPGWYWLSFVDTKKPEGTDRFLGVAIVYASGVLTATDRAWALGINPGGEVGCMGPLREEFVPEHVRNRLLSAEELEREGLSAPRGSTEEDLDNEAARAIERIQELEGRIVAAGYELRYPDYCEDADTPGLLGYYAGVTDHRSKVVKIAMKSMANRTPEQFIATLEHEVQHVEEPGWDCGNRDVFGRGP